MNILPLIILALLALVVIFLLRDANVSHPSYGSGWGKFFLYILFQIVLLGTAVFLALTLMESIIFVPITFLNVLKVTLSIWVIYFTLSIKGKMTIT